MPNFLKNDQKGQSLLIIVLVMIIALTVGLALVTRTITSVKTSTEEASSQKALGAAEAGIEQSIKSNSAVSNPSFGTDTNSKTKFQTSISPISGRTFLVNGGNVVQRDDDADVWMSDYSTQSAKLYLNPVSSNISVNFGTSSDACSNPAIEVDVISGSKAAPIQNNYAFDPCVSRRTSNHFSAPAGGTGDLVQGIQFKYKTPDAGQPGAISVTNGLFIRIVPIYQDSKIGITSSADLPSQGAIINSVGSSGNTKRSVIVYQGYPKIPAEFFPYSLFSP